MEKNIEAYLVLYEIDNQLLSFKMTFFQVIKVYFSKVNFDIFLSVGGKIGND